MSLNSKANSLKSSGSLTHILEVPTFRFSSNKTIITRLNLARKKLFPVINEILKTASENTSRSHYQAAKSYHLTIEQYKDAIWASNVLKEVDEILKFNKIKRFNKSFKPQNCNFDTKNIKVNKSGKIYVDTPILVQLIDLHKMLGDIVDYIQDLPIEGVEYSKESQKKQKPSQFKSDVNSECSTDKRKKAEGRKMTRDILTSLTTMPLNSNFLVMAANSYQKSQMPCLPEERSTSEVNLNRRNTVEIRHCKSTGSVMNTKQKVVDAVAARKIIIRCLADLDRVKQYIEQDACLCKKTPSAGSLVEEPRECHDNEDHSSDETEPLNFVWKDDGENSSKLIICIKGKSEEDGDIHIVIRQCPECVPCKKSSQRFSVSIENLEKMPGSKISCSNKKSSQNKVLFREPSRHQSQSDAINVLFDPDEPSQSVVEGPQIRLFETINLNLQNTEGQDLVISLSVRPKFVKNATSGFNIEDIFSECSCSNKKFRTHVVERMIPLSRIKICSSMDFDVGLVVSELKMTGVQHPKPEVSERLNELGVYNILRASRPVKCGRMAILNEHKKKYLPYAASLRSLPLDDEDITVINQSLNMSLHKSKHSKIFPDGTNSDNHMHLRFCKCVYFLQIWQQGMKFYENWEIRKELINKKLSFYIYLEDDVKQFDNSYEVRYFDVVNKNNPANDKTKTKKRKDITTVNKKLTVSTSHCRNVDISKQNHSSVKNSRKSRIPVYIKKYANKGKEAISISQLNSTPRFNSSCRRQLTENDNKIISTKHKINIPKSRSNVNKINSEYNPSSNEDDKSSSNYCSCVDINKINSVHKTVSNSINSTRHETAGNCQKINSDSQITSIQKGIKITSTKHTFNNINNKKIIKNILKHYDINNYGCGGDFRSIFRMKDNHDKINSSGDISSALHLNSKTQLIPNDIIKLTVNTVFNNNSIYTNNNPLMKTQLKQINKKGNDRNKVSLVTIKTPEDNSLRIWSEQNSFASAKSLEEINSVFKKKENDRNKVSLVTIKKPEDNSFRILSEQNSFASVKSLEKLDSVFKNTRNKKKKSFILKVRKKKKEFYTSRSLTQLLVGNSGKKNFEFVNFINVSNKKPQKTSTSTSAHLVLSSTRFNKDLNPEKTFSKMIVNKFSKFLYDTFIRELSTEAKIELLSKVDEFLDKYSKLQATSAKYKCRKNKGRFCS